MATVGECDSRALYRVRTKYAGYLLEVWQSPLPTPAQQGHESFAFAGAYRECSLFISSLGPLHTYKVWQPDRNIQVMIPGTVEQEVGTRKGQGKNRR